MKRVALPFLSLASGVALFMGAPEAAKSNGSSSSTPFFTASPPTAVQLPPTVIFAPAPTHTDVSAGNVEGALATIAAAPVATVAVPTAGVSRRDDRERARRKIRDGAAGTYIGEILQERDSSIARWADRRGIPLTVWIQPKSRVADFSPVYVARVRQAFEEWGALNLPIRFSFVHDSSDAEVHVKWIDRFTAPISGRTRWSRDDNWVITNADITLAMHHSQGDALDEESMRAMALHEIGHLLGLDHTSDSLSVMAPKVRVRELSEADRATVRLVYALPAGPLR